MWIPQLYSLIPVTLFTQFIQEELQPYLYSYYSTVFRQLGRAQAETFSGTGERVGVEMAVVAWKFTGVTREFYLEGWLFPIVLHSSYFPMIAAFSSFILVLFFSSFQLFTLLRIRIVCHGNLCLLLGFSRGSQYTKYSLNLKLMKIMFFWKQNKTNPNTDFGQS